MSYSFSQIQTYLKCPMQYRLDKIDKAESLIPQLNLNLTLWTCVHDLLIKKDSTIINLLTILNTKNIPHELCCSTI